VVLGGGTDLGDGEALPPVLLLILNPSSETRELHKVMRELLPETELASAAALALLCGSAAAVVVWKWLSKRHIQKKMEEAQRTRDEGVKKMAKAVQQFREQVTHPRGELRPTGVSAHVLQLLLLAHLSIAFITRIPGEMCRQPSARGKAVLGGREITSSEAG